jgi:hypothetical protein
LAHELAHVVQHCVVSTPRLAKLRLGDPHDPAEHEAERAAAAIGERDSLGGSIAETHAIKKRGFAHRASSLELCCANSSPHLDPVAASGGSWVVIVAIYSLE